MLEKKNGEMMCLLENLKWKVVFQESIIFYNTLRVATPRIHEILTLVAAFTIVYRFESSAKIKSTKQEEKNQ